MATEEAPYTVEKESGGVEIRNYEAHILAETMVDGTLEDAGNKAFRRLFNYISGVNHSRSSIAMTAPVSQQSAAGKWAVSFMMPASYTIETLPIPDDSSITLRQVPAHRVAAVRYSGFWSEKRFLLNKQKLENWIKDNNLKIIGEPVWARYNPPFTIWFLRRNEILIPIATE